MKHKIPKVGDTIVLDCGYGAHMDDQPCKILEVKDAVGLFGDKKNKCPTEKYLVLTWEKNL